MTDRSRRAPLPPGHRDDTTHTHNMARSFLFACLVALLFGCVLVAAISPPPVFEHKAERNVKGTNCEVCQAVVKQALRKIGTKQPDLSTQKSRRAREQKVSDVMEGICDVQSFSRYEFSPPTMVTACNDFVSNHGEELEELLYKGVVDDAAIRQRVCLGHKVCDKLWSPEEEEQKRDRSPEEARKEAEEAAAAAKKAKAEEKAKKKAEAAKKKAEKEAAKRAAAEETVAAEEQKDEL